MDMSSTQLLLALVATPLGTLAVVVVGQMLNHRTGKARADEIKADLAAQIKEVKSDLIANMSQLRNDLSSNMMRSEATVVGHREELKEWFKAELRASLAELRASLLESQGSRTRAVGQVEKHEPSPSGQH
jgi:hypothetical protein